MGSREQAEDGTEVLIVGGPPKVAPLAVVLTFEGVEAKPARFVLETGTCVIGSGIAADILLDDPAVSRSHAELSLAPEGVAVCDLGSRNGTFYLGQRVEKITLTPGSRFQVGRATVCVDADTTSLDVPSTGSRNEYGALVGRSAHMHRLFAILERLEGSLVPVLVEGESGVGKELVAAAIHEHSAIARGPFVVLNCAAFGRELLASELFGHKKGAFTGANENRRGAVDSADGGTLFLDELGEMPLDVQPMLLRFLESGEVRPVGSDSSRTVRVRVVAATNRDLEERVAAGQFRQDLFYRLAVVRLWVPPLRERPEDVEPTALHLATMLGLPPLSPQLVARLRARPWAGNVRELRNVLQAYAVLGDLADKAGDPKKRVDPAAADAFDLDRPYLEQKDELIERFTRAYLNAMLDRTAGNQAEAARLAGLDRTYLGRLLKQYGMTK
jgi:two-component system, NtrC family, nitrogen regulation response regulator GlnG